MEFLAESQPDVQRERGRLPEVAASSRLMLLHNPADPGMHGYSADHSILCCMDARVHCLLRPPPASLQQPERMRGMILT